MDVYEKGLPLLCVILDNRCAAMTGKQPALPLDRYIGWANPHYVPVHAKKEIQHLLETAAKPGVIVIRGTCPEGQEHEIVAYRDM
jgi:TPP-dependent indolepyruvate ferredoxin oxidoreductase alpha subunit